MTDTSDLTLLRGGTNLRTLTVGTMLDDEEQNLPGHTRVRVRKQGGGTRIAAWKDENVVTGATGVM